MMLILMLNFLSILQALQLYSKTALLLGECTVKGHGVSNFLLNGSGKISTHMPRGTDKANMVYQVRGIHCTFNFSIGLKFFRIKVGRKIKILNVNTVFKKQLAI